MPGRRFRDARTETRSQPTAADLAHQNLLAINEDLRHKVALLEASQSYRLGRLILRMLRPVFVVLRLRRFLPQPPKITVTTLWPIVSGRLVMYQPSMEQIPVQVFVTGKEVLSHAIDPYEVIRGRPTGPWEVDFTFHYELGFSEFDRDDLVLRIGNDEFRDRDLGSVSVERSRICRPIDVAAASIIAVHGSPDALREKLRTRRSVAVIATFRDAERPHGPPDHLIESLTNEGFLTVVVDTSASLPSQPLSCDLSIHRLNVGWDFASWMSTLARFPWLMDDADRLLLVNDSNVGPLRPIGPMMESGRTLGLDVWGLTDSWDTRYHLQSYFLLFEQSALRSGHLHSFLDSFTFPSVKDKIIGSGEIGLSRFLDEAGLRIGAVFPYTELAQTFLDGVPERIDHVLSFPENQLDAARVSDIDEVNFILDTVDRIRSSAPVNPTHYFWDILVDKGSPFVKRELLTKNPQSIPGLHRLVDKIAGEPGEKVLEREVSLWSRSHPDVSLPLALHWQPRHH